MENAVRTSGQADTAALRQALTNELIARQLLAQRALKANYDRRPEVQAALDRARTIVLAEAWAHDNAHPAPVSDADVRAAYDRIVGALGKTEYKPSAIVMVDAGSAQRAAQALARGADFAQVARQYSRGPTAPQGGALPWVSFKLPVQAGQTQNWPVPLAQGLAALPRGGYTKTPVQVGDNYYLVRKDDERPTQVPGFEASKAAVRQQLELSAVQAANAAMIADLTREAKIQR
ncbi:MAG: peptidylprolyl isomerase [Janthinobacterium lividum]